MCRFDPKDGGNMLLLVAGIHLKDYKILQQQQALTVEGQYGNSTALNMHAMNLKGSLGRAVA